MTDENPYNINKGQYLACPSCGSDVICYSESNDRLVCDSCGCSMSEERWNNRVYPAEVLEAIEKQKPKKPDDSWNGRSGVCDCGYESLRGKRFCANCGQRLDWSEE